MRKPIFIIVLVALTVRLLLAACLYNIGVEKGYDGFFYGGDDYAYGDTGVLLANEWRKGNYPYKLTIRNTLTLSNAMGGYQYYLAGLMFISNNNTFLPILLNCVFGTLCVLLIYLIALKLFSEKVALIAAGLCALSPSLIFWSSMNFKLASTMLLILIFAFVIIKRKFLNVLLGLSIIAIMGKFRPSVQPILIVAYIIHLAMWFAENKPRVAKVSLAIIAIIILMGITNMFSMPNIVDAERVDAERNLRVGGDSAIMPDVRLNSSLKLIKFFPKALSIAFLYPLPYKATSPLYLLSIPEMLLWYLLLIFFIRGLFLARGIGFILFFTIIYFLALGYMETNCGTLIRHRALILPFSFIFISRGMCPSISGRIDDEL